MAEPDWVDVGSVDELRTSSLQQVTARKTKIALSYQDDEFCAISNACNHVGGPLGEGTLDGEFVVCPWHYWKFHRKTGKGSPDMRKTKCLLFRSRWNIIEYGLICPRQPSGGNSLMPLIHWLVPLKDRKDRFASWAFPRP